MQKIKQHLNSLSNLPSRRAFRNLRKSSLRIMSLSRFLADTKQQYLKAVQEGKGHEWVVVMGNEAGDLDSAASSIAYSWFASTIQKTSCVALLQTSRADLKLRPENVHAFSIASLSPSGEELLCIDDIPSTTPFPSNRFALVDHNRLLPQFTENNEDVQVVAVLDHHDDEGMYKDSAEPRTIIVPIGSASSIVTQHIARSTSQILPEVARLLLCAILVDTGGLKPGGKAEDLDREAVAHLLPHTELGALSTTSLSGDIHSAVSPLANELQAKKSDVAHLSTIDLLRRDYKQYAWVLKKRTVHVGLSTVPVDLRIWLARESLGNFWREVDTFMSDRKLDILGILTTFQKEKHPKKKKRGGDADGQSEGKKSKHKRQVLIIIRDVPDGELERRLRAGLERDSELSLEPRSFVKFVTRHRKYKHHSDSVVPDDEGIGDRIVLTFKQGNVKATRKVIAPLLRRIIEGELDES